MTPEEQAEFYMYQMNKPCSRCYKMPIEHKHCPCLVIGCCGYAVDERCTEKLPSILVADGPQGPINFLHDSIAEAKVTIWDPKSTIMFQGPRRTAQYSFEVKENIIKRILYKLKILKRKQSLISEDWNPDIIASMKKEMASVGWSDEFTLAKHEPDIFKMWIERLERERNATST